MESNSDWQRDIPLCLICSAELETTALSQNSSYNAGDLLLCRVCSNELNVSRAINVQPTRMSNTYQYPQMTEPFGTQIIPQTLVQWNVEHSLVQELDTLNPPRGIVPGEDISNNNQLLTSPGLPQVQDQASPAASQTWFDDYHSVPEPTNQQDHSTPSSRDEVNTMIGSMHKSTNPDTVFFKCSHSSCKDKTFGRWYEIRRHYWSVHKTREEDFWCSATGCKRSETVGGEPFPRKDKLAEHVQKKHGR